jgi:hypothetical protein
VQDGEFLYYWVPAFTLFYSSQFPGDCADRAAVVAMAAHVMLPPQPQLRQRADNKAGARRNRQAMPLHGAP